MNRNKQLEIMDLFAGAGGFALAGCEVTCSLEMDQSVFIVGNRIAW